MEFFEPTQYHHQHPHYPHEQMSHYSDVHQSYAMAQPAPMIAMPNIAKANETKPRLGKDEVDILEREFKKNPKPTTQTKRQFAEEMGVDLARINNWFQNRRAKRKQEKKQEANEAGRARDAMGYSEPSSPDFYSQGSGYYSDNSQTAPTQQSSAQFSTPIGPPTPVASCNPQYTNPSTASMESFHRTMVAAQAGSGLDGFSNFAQRHNSIYEEQIHDFSGSDRAQFPPPSESLDHFDIGQAYSYPSTFSNSPYLDLSRSLSFPQVQSPGEESNSTPTPFSNFQTAGQEAPVPQLLTTLPTQLLPSRLFDGLPQQSDEQFTQSPEPIREAIVPIGFTYDCAEANESSMSPPPGSSMTFRSPPPRMDIASRRKVQVKPAALVADTLRGRPSMGPRTVSQAEGFRRTTHSPATSPMRRIVSAGGNRNVLNGRISKSGFESSQRSPINLGGFADAGSFLEYNHQNIRHPSLTAGSSLSSSLAPPTPMSPRESEMTFPKTESNRSTASPIEGGVNFVFNAGVPGCFTTMEGDQNLASPPETPHALLAVSSDSWANNLDLSDKTWQFDVQDEPLYTPAQDSFSTEIHMPQPLYLGNMSQPVTPAFGHFNHNVMFGHESPQFKNEPAQYTLPTQSGSEYTFPESNQQYLAMSPATTKQKTFQFSHTTAADFSEK
ncbi:uncharacterized protein RSE6_11247 [Rhynchosporium secalis]|uniref:Homeobox domain-containing protein n=1 Tax=Rhynchosporium secalis TaxID=38038 RepID=A0A1E1MMH3_RHYSE|nr:uncharacterized protein RSE6_11247 [Rhynchosporium secalis]